MTIVVSIVPKEEAPKEEAPKEEAPMLLLASDSHCHRNSKGYWKQKQVEWELTEDMPIKEAPTEKTPMEVAQMITRITTLNNAMSNQ